ncbi:MAG: MATE family efflux transporter [Pseudomonadales bacterium]
MRLLPDADRSGRILRLGLPIMGGMSTYTLLELMDVVFVGYLGTTALAAVGICVFVTFSYLSLFGGVTVAVQASTARLVGEQSARGEAHCEDVERFLRSALLIVLIAAPLGAVVLGSYATGLLQLMNDDPAVTAVGSPYLRWSFAAGVFLTLNNAFMGFWNATDRPRLYLRVVLLQAVVKLPLNYMLMFGWGAVPAYGVEGAGMSTCAAALAGSLYHAASAWRHAPGFLRGPTRSQSRIVLRLLVPAGSQQFLENLALTLMFRIVALIGTVEVAGYTVLVNLVGAVGLPAWGLGMAGATLVGQAMGAGDPDAADRWAWDVVRVGTLAMILLGVPFWVAPEWILALFIHDAGALAVAVWPCRVLGLMIGINGLGYLFASLLYGAGDVKRVLYVNLATQYLVLLPGAYLAGVHLGFGLLGVWLVHQFAFRALNAVVLTTLWRQRRWAAVRLW